MADGHSPLKSVPGHDSDYAAAFALAQRVVQEEPRRLLMKATERALVLENATRTISECEQLVKYWDSMREFITGSMAKMQLEAVLNGGMAPRSASAPKK
jgi:hypothetical protein